MVIDSLLVVEDDPLIRDLLESVLAEEGFQVVTATDGMQATAHLHADATRFKAMITDIRLGAGPDGWDVAQLARALVPDLPIVYISGDSARDWPAKGVPNSVYIQKPFTLTQLVTAISRLLGGTRAGSGHLPSDHEESGCLMTRVRRSGA
jgi:DNA-binding response OmpR family regulator